jgi:hypothetical protein
LHDLVGGGVLEQEAAGPGAQGVDDVFVEPEGGYGSLPLLRRPVPDAAGRFIEGYAAL